MFKPAINLFHVIASVPDLDRTLKFYQEVLDFKVIMDVRNFEAIEGSGDYINVAVVERADDVIAMMEFTQWLNKDVAPLPEHPTYGYWAVTWEVQDVDKIYSEWVNRGVESTMKPTVITMPDSVKFYSAFIKDIDGHSIELAQIIP